MCAAEKKGIFIDYEYVHNTLERTYQVNPDPRQIYEAIKKNTAGPDADLVLQRAYAPWDSFKEAKKIFAENAIETIDTAYVQMAEPTKDTKTAQSPSCTDIAICLDLVESAFTTQDLHIYILVLGDSRYEEIVKRLKAKNLQVVIVGFSKNISPSLTSKADDFLILDDIIKRHHVEDVTRIVEIYVSLSRKLPYVGYKYLMDLISRNDLHTDYRQLLNQAQDEGIFRLVEVDDPNTVRGKAFAVELVSTNPAVAKHLSEMGLGTETLSSPESVQLREDDFDSFEALAAKDHSDPRFLAGKRLVEVGQYEAAISEFFNYLEDFPNDFLGFVYVINCLIKNGDRSKASIWCKKALNLPNAARNQKEYPRWFTYMKRVSSMETETEEEGELEEPIKLNG